MSLSGTLAAVAAAAPDRIALRFEDTAWRFADLLASAGRDAAMLAAAGVGVGDRVAVLALNHPRTLSLLLACERLGAMLAPLNWRLAGPELEWILADCTPRLLLTDAAAPPVEAPGIARMAIDADAPDAPLPDGAPADPRRTLLLVYTSGTTGRPKGAMLSAGALLANARLSWDMHAMRPDDHVLTVLPFFHVGGLNVQTLPALLLGARVTLHARFDPAATLAAIAAARPSLTVLVPATLQALMAQPGWAAAELSSLRAITTGSTVVQPSIVAPVVARGIPVLQVYGSTETAPVAIYTTPGRAYPSTSTGHPGPDCRAIAVDGDGHRLPPGTAGEIWLRGPQLFDGYWRNPQATAAAFHDGWYRTGDIGTEDADGSWTVHDRRRNLIVSGGENIYPAEIERVLHELPAVAEAAVIGVPDPRWQQVPEAHVVLRPGAACSEAEIIAHVHAQLARFKAPRRVLFRDSLPRNAMGKVRHDLLQGAP